ncbi:MAG: bestrophin family ion channel [Polyangiales bacterium]
MIIRNGTGFKRAMRWFVLRNWFLILFVVFVEELMVLTKPSTDVFQTNVFSATAVGLLATVVGIFIVFRFNEAYQRWWEARILWGGLVNESRNFAREVITFITPERARGVDISGQPLQDGVVPRRPLVTSLSRAARFSGAAQQSFHRLPSLL